MSKTMKASISVHKTLAAGHRLKIFNLQSMMRMLLFIYADAVNICKVNYQKSINFLVGYANIIY